MDQRHPGRTHDSLHAQLTRDHKTIKEMYGVALATSALSEARSDHWAEQATSDVFVAMVSRHLAAVEDVLYPAARRLLPEAKPVTKAYVSDVRGIEQTMRHLLASMYGEVHDVDTPRRELWSELADRMDAHLLADERLAAAVEETLPESEQHVLAAAYRTSFGHAPTRPHPYSPHASLLGRVSNRLWSLADRALDVMDNREVPQRPHPPNPKRGNLVSQYLLGRPAFDASVQPMRRGRR